ncbi:MAG: prepilin-type N-terminal cleavage/methylation domain-containing protein [Planctomycetes bacterium]|nr:prepilin-type N-terminal cleavage/methylation domain-containing protein [Planctomycetota bacterium]
MNREDGFTLIEALVALAIVAMIVLTFLGIRTTALIDATYARNWRLAREIAEARMSELQAGHHEVAPESGQSISLADKYEDGWSYKIIVGESAVADAESEIADLAAGGEGEASERSEWERGREDYRKARAEGLSYQEYQDKLYEEQTARDLEEQAPSEDDVEEVAVIVYFPKLDAEHEGEQDALMIKARISTLAISGLTPRQAQAVAESRGQTSAAATGSTAEGGN